MQHGLDVGGTRRDPTGTKSSTADHRNYDTRVEQSAVPQRRHEVLQERKRPTRTRIANAFRSRHRYYHKMQIYSYNNVLFYKLVRHPAKLLRHMRLFQYT